MPSLIFHACGVSGLRTVFVLSACLLALCNGPAQAAQDVRDGTGRFGSGAIAANWQVVDGRLASLTVEDAINHVGIPVTAPFELTFKDGRILSTANMPLATPPRTIVLPAEPGAARLAARAPGAALQASFSTTGGIKVDWRLVQRQGSDYLREEITIHADGRDVPITRVGLMGATVKGAIVDGEVDGSPVVAGRDYFGFEHPMAKAQTWDGKARMWVKRTLPLRAGTSVSYSAVIGVTRAGQLRRDFSTYVERERAHPYRPFLHYNSWFDIGYFTPYTEAEALSRINAFGRELVEKRHVKLDSFLFDDGWDDYSGSWRFSKAFPHGFVRLKEAAEKYGAAPGIWLSPWGGYGKPHDLRIKNGRESGYGIVDDGLALSAPEYWKRFHHVVMNLLDRDGVNQFKFDGTGNVDSVYPGSRFDSDFAAAIQLIEDIRADKPGTFINLTTGTWASPFWLRYADSIWRGGNDTDFTGDGSERERWITYRDEQVYRNVVEKGPLFPLNSLMLHGIVYALHAQGLNTAQGHDFSNEVHSYFATGTDLQELYITPSLLSAADWDMLADAARWARSNAKVLEDTHWIGGDPGRLDVYGWAAWTPQKAIITFRNPSGKSQMAVVDLARQLELPTGAITRFKVKNVWQSAGRVPDALDASVPGTLELAPFEVLTLELTPQG